MTYSVKHLSLRFSLQLLVFNVQIRQNALNSVIIRVKEPLDTDPLGVDLRAVVHAPGDGRGTNVLCWRHGVTHHHIVRTELHCHLRGENK